MLKKQNEKKEKDKDEAYYVKKIEDLHKLKVNGNALMVCDEKNDDENVEVWSTESKDEFRRQPHGDWLIVKGLKNESGERCFMVKSVILESQRYFTNEGMV